jgi:hypothetical protein
VVPFPETAPHFCVSVQGFTPIQLDPNDLQRKPASREEEKSDWPVFRTDINEAGCYTTLLQGFASYNKQGQLIIEAGLSLLEVITLIQQLCVYLGAP